MLLENCVFMRSWNWKPRSGWRTFLEDLYGSLFVGERGTPGRAVQTHSERLKDLVSQGYKEESNTPGALRYVKDRARTKSRDKTTEWVPLSSSV